MKFEKRFLNLFLIGIILIVFQSFLQNTTYFSGVISKSISLVKPFIYGVFIAITLYPMVELIERKLKCKSFIALILSIIIVIIFFIGFTFLIVPSIISSFEDIIEKFPMFQERFFKYLEDIFVFLKEKNLLLMNGEEVKIAIEDFFIQNTNNIKSILISFGLNVIDLILEVFIILLGSFLAMYFIFDKEYFIRFIKRFIYLFNDKKVAEKGYLFLVDCKNIFLNYLLGRIIVSFAVGLIAYIIMFLANVPYALINGILLGVGNMVPYFGSIFAGTFAFFLIILVDPIKVVYLFIAITVAQMVDGYIIGPKIIGKSVGISSFWTIASVIILGNLFGTIGMFLGVPIFAIIKLIFNRAIAHKQESEKQNNTL